MRGDLSRSYRKYDRSAAFTIFIGFVVVGTVVFQFFKVFVFVFMSFFSFWYFSLFVLHFFGCDAVGGLFFQQGGYFCNIVIAYGLVRPLKIVA